MEIIYRSSGLRVDTLMSNVKNVNVNVCSNHVMRDDHHNLDEVSSGLVEYLFMGNKIENVCTWKLRPYVTVFRIKNIDAFMPFYE